MRNSVARLLELTEVFDAHRRGGRPWTESKAKLVLKSVVKRVLAERLSRIADLYVGVIHHPQSNFSDFYRQLGDLFRISIRISNRLGG